MTDIKRFLMPTDKLSDETLNNEINETYKFCNGLDDDSIIDAMNYATERKQESTDIEREYWKEIETLLMDDIVNRFIQEHKHD